MPDSIAMLCCIVTTGKALIPKAVGLLADNCIQLLKIPREKKNSQTENYPQTPKSWRDSFHTMAFSQVTI